MNIIIFGKMGAGKSTVARAIVHNFDVMFAPMHIASLGKKIHSETRLHGSETREEMQRYGQAMREIFGIDVWCDSLHRQVLATKLDTVIDDGRQVNELQYFADRGYVTIGVDAIDEVRRNRIVARTGKKPSIEEMNHDTENQAGVCVRCCDYKIRNDGTLDELQLQINDLCDRLLDIPQD